MKFIRSVPYFFLTVVLLQSCRTQSLDLVKLKLNQKAEDVINFKEKNRIGFETVSIPFDLIIETVNTSAFSFGSVKLENANIYFQIYSDKARRDTALHDGMGHYNVTPFKTIPEMKTVFKQYDADSTIYGYQVEIKNDKIKSSILKEIVKLYGSGTKNPNTDNGLFWNVKSEKKYIFFAPDYDRLIVLNNTKLSKTCYWDSMNGVIDFGGCDKETYLQGLTK
jgi:hypothetical protein